MEMRRGRAPIRREAPEPLPRPLEHRPRERPPPPPSAHVFGPRPPPEPRRSSPILQPRAQETATWRPRLNSRFPDLSNGPSDPSASVATNTPMALDSVLDDLRRGDPLRSHRRPSPLRNMWPSEMHRPSFSNNDDGTVESLRQVQQDASRLPPSAASIGSENTHREYLAAPSLPSPGLGEFDLSLFSETEQHPRRTSDARPSALGNTLFRDYLARRRSPSPPYNRGASNHDRQPVPRRPSPPPRTSTSNLARGAIDPSAYAPGPFRNTMQRVFDAHMAMETRMDTTHGQQTINSNLPSLPPLAFDNVFSTLYESSQQENNVRFNPFVNYLSLT